MKYFNYLDFCEVIELVNNKIHISSEGLNKV